MRIDDLLDLMEESLEDALMVPLTGRRMVNVDKMQELIDEVRANFPSQFRKAKEIVKDRDKIMENANKEADMILKRAEARSEVMVSQEDVAKQASKQAKEALVAAQSQAAQTAALAKEEADSLLATAKKQAAEMRQNAFRFSEGMLKRTEDVLFVNHSEVKALRSELLESAKLKQGKK